MGKQTVEYLLSFYKALSQVSAKVWIAQEKKKEKKGFQKHTYINDGSQIYYFYK